MKRANVRKSPHEVRPTGTAVDEKMLLWNQEGVILDTTEMICTLMWEADVTRGQLAERMGITECSVTRMLDGCGNLTIRKLSDILTHLGYEFKASIQTLVDKTRRMQYNTQGRQA